ncbi:hypothetical protein [Pararhizobium gei]|uniref:hypothetical protein n=1 Tax=Pararhizobium gei TaxID=1395951 RepID=UPI0023DA0386|nr:hypothetical protein [Rhizobium gei]
MQTPALCLAIVLIGVSPVAAEPIESQKIITALTGDFNGDGGQDLVMIVETEPTADMDMHFFLRDMEHDFLKPVDVARGKITGEWNGYDRPGYEASDTEPQLALLPGGEIKLFIPAPPVGSARTDQTLTLAYRENRFVVSGFSYEYRDFLDETVGSQCSYSVLEGTGRSARKNDAGSMVDKPVSVPAKTIPFREWEISTGFDACGG